MTGPDATRRRRLVAFWKDRDRQPARLKAAGVDEWEIARYLPPFLFDLQGKARLPTELTHGAGIQRGIQGKADVLVAKKAAASRASCWFAGMRFATRFAGLRYA